MRGSSSSVPLICHKKPLFVLLFLSSSTRLPLLTQHPNTILHYTVPSLCPVLLNCYKTKYHFRAFQHCPFDGWTDDTVHKRVIFSPTKNLIVGKTACPV